MDIKKYVQFSKPKHFLKQEFVTEKYSQNTAFLFITIYALKIKNMKKHDFFEIYKNKITKKVGFYLVADICQHLIN